MDISITREKPNSEELFSLLKEVDADYAVPLSKKRDLWELSNKLVSRSDVISARTREGILAGIVAGYISSAYSDVGYITIVAVRRPYRGRGIASRMMEAFLAFAKEFEGKIAAVDIYTTKDNAAARSVYLKAGFEVYHSPMEERPEDLHLIKYLRHE